jgi:hypothetical protein
MGYRTKRHLLQGERGRKKRGTIGGEICQKMWVDEALQIRGLRKKDGEKKRGEKRMEKQEGERMHARKIWVDEAWSIRGGDM